MDKNLGDIGIGESKIMTPEKKKQKRQGTIIMSSIAIFVFTLIFIVSYLNSDFYQSKRTRTNTKNTISQYIENWHVTDFRVDLKGEILREYLIAGDWQSKINAEIQNISSKTKKVKLDIIILDKNNIEIKNTSFYYELQPNQTEYINVTVNCGNYIPHMFSYRITKP